MDYWVYTSYFLDPLGFSFCLLENKHISRNHQMW
jgi:hypothetical protein